MSAKNLQYRYGKRTVLENIELRVETGMVTVLIGPNGSGKSTLLRLIAGVLSIQSGEVTVGNRPIGKIGAREMARLVAYVPQDTGAPYAFTVEELIGLGINDATGNAAKARIDESLSTFDLTDLRNRNLLTLSGGERQRAHIARGWAQNTSFLILDEPTAHLDVGHQSSLLNILSKAAHSGKRGIVVALHDLNLAATFADRLILLHNGTVLAAGLPVDVLTESTLRTVYGVAVRIRPDAESGRLLILPSV